MEAYVSGALVWDTSEADPPRWVLMLAHPEPGNDPQRLDPQDPFTPQDASQQQLRDLIVMTLDTAQNPRSGHIALEPVEPGQRYRFRVTYRYP